jgi:hydroxyethylthiazole kinase-like sugar kinase family protein
LASIVVALSFSSKDFVGWRKENELIVAVVGTGITDGTVAAALLSVPRVRNEKAEVTAVVCSVMAAV